MRTASFSLICLTLLGHLAFAQTRPLPAGFQRVEGKHVDIITDMPLSDEIRALPSVFDAAVPQWCQVFGLGVAEVDDWHCEAFIMLDRSRFKSAGLIPNHLPNFPYGFQSGNQMWVAEQPSDYYRRHLLLHEGTHWFMSRKYGDNGPPWLMEGMAEWLGTHRWNAVTNVLEMGVIPRTKDEVPYWGRVSLIQEQLTTGLAPSLETVLRYGNTAHQEVEAYAWSWAAVLFLSQHPHSRDEFQKMLALPKMKPDSTLTRWLFGRLRSNWPSLRQEWSAMLTDLEYGFDPTRGMLTLSTKPTDMTSAAPQVHVIANQTWQASGIRVAANSKYKISSQGRYVVGQTSADWECEPEGVTLEYYRGQPLGKLLLTVVSPLPEEPRFATPLTTIPVGGEAELRMPRSGELHFRINESSSGLADNSGQLTIRIEPLE